MHRSQRPQRLRTLGAHVSPIPIRIPLVNGIRSSPAPPIVSGRRSGSLSGEAQCGPPFAERRSATVSSMIPIEAETDHGAASSSRFITGIQMRQEGPSPRAPASRPGRGSRASTRSRARPAPRATLYRSSGLSPSAEKALRCSQRRRRASTSSSSGTALPFAAWAVVAANALVLVGGMKTFGE